MLYGIYKSAVKKMKSEPLGTMKRSTSVSSIRASVDPLSPSPMENIVTVRAMDNATPRTVRTTRLCRRRRLLIEYTLTRVRMGRRI